MSIVEEINRSLLEDEAEAKRHGDEFPGPAAQDAFLRLVANMTPLLEAGTNLKWVAFPDGEHVDFVVRSPDPHNRRIDFTVSGRSEVEWVRIDENMNCYSGRVGEADILVLDALIGWLSEP